LKNRRYNTFRLIRQPTLTGGQAKFLYPIVEKIGGEPGHSRWLTFTEVVNRAEAAGYKQELHPEKGNVEVPDSVYYWLNRWTKQGDMERKG